MSPIGLQAGVVAAALFGCRLALASTPSQFHVGLYFAMGSGLVVYAKHVGLTNYDLGFAGSDSPGGGGGSGCWGSVVAALVVLSLLVVAAVPAGRRLLADDRFDQVSAADASLKLLIDIPLIVGFEELAFRGVFLGVLTRRCSERRAVAASSVLFGLWHILSAGSNPAAIAGTVIVTTVAGVVFAVVRLRDATIASPLLVHGLLNGTAYSLGWLSTHQL